MLIAEIRRKLLDLEELDPEQGDVIEQVRSLLRETKEDLLTSDVFGTLKYLPRQPYLEAVLCAIADRNPHAEHYKQCVDEFRPDIESCDFRFWPSYPTPVGLPGSTTEPDVQISSAKLLLFFEAKLQSGFGEHQVERELVVGLEQARGREFFLVLVTASASPPRISSSGHRLNMLEYLHSVSELPFISADVAKRLKNNAHRVLWISWQAVISALDSAYNQHCEKVGTDSAETQRVADILNDLKELMLMRGIQSFKGFSDLAERGEVLCTRLGFVLGIPGFQARAFRGLTSDVLPELAHFAIFPSTKPLLFHPARKQAFVGITPRILPMDLPNIVASFRLTNQEKVGMRFRIPNKYTLKGRVNVTEIVKYRATEKMLNQLFPWRRKNG